MDNDGHAIFGEIFANQRKPLSALGKLYCKHRLVTELSTDFGDNFFEHGIGPSSHRPEPDALLNGPAFLIQTGNLLSLGFGSEPLESRQTRIAARLAVSL
jgi:hypothetical protein